MPIKTELFDFDRESVADGASLQDQVSQAPTPACANADCGGPGPSRRWDEAPQEARAILRFFLGERRMRMDQGQPMANRPLSAVLTGCDRAAARAEISGARAEFSEPVHPAIPGADSPGVPRSSMGPLLPDQPRGPAAPVTLNDRAFPQRGWEHEYGVPSYLVGAADVLHYHRKRVASADGDVIDAAILRLYAPWIRRGAASSPIPKKAEDGGQ